MVVLLVSDIYACVKFQCWGQINSIPRHSSGASIYLYHMTWFRGNMCRRLVHMRYKRFCTNEIRGLNIMQKIESGLTTDVWSLWLCMLHLLYSWFKFINCPMPGLQHCQAGMSKMPKRFKWNCSMKIQTSDTNLILRVMEDSDTHSNWAIFTTVKFSAIINSTCCLVMSYFGFPFLPSYNLETYLYYKRTTEYNNNKGIVITKRIPSQMKVTWMTWPMSDSDCWSYCQSFLAVGVTVEKQT